MKIIDNFSELALVTEQTIMFMVEGESNSIYMKLPSFIETITDLRLRRAFNTIAIDEDSLEKFEKSAKIATLYDLVKILSLQQKNHPVFFDICYLFAYCFREQFNEQEFLLSDIKISHLLFDRIIEIIRIANGQLKISEQRALAPKKSAALEAAERKIRRIKAKNQPLHGNTQNQDQAILKMFSAINVELGYTFEELQKMNYYHIDYLRSLAIKHASYDVQKRAVAAGMTKKKLKYITE